MKPDIWGKHLWYSIHFIALDYSEKPSEEEKKQYFDFFSNLHKVIPCFECSKHYEQNIKTLPLTTEYLKNNDKLFEWTVKLHNLVNKQLNKKEMSLKNAKYLYNNFTNNNHNYFLYCILFISIILNIYYIGSIFFKNKRLFK